MKKIAYNFTTQGIDVVYAENVDQNKICREMAEKKNTLAIATARKLHHTKMEGIVTNSDTLITCEAELLSFHESFKQLAEKLLAQEAVGTSKEFLDGFLFRLREACAFIGLIHDAQIYNKSDFRNWTRVIRVSWHKTKNFKTQ